MLSNRRLSRSARLTRAFTAVLTVWCLGCSAFDSVISELAGRGNAMMCGADDVGDGGVAIGAGSGSADSMPIVSSQRDADQQTVICDCQSCCAPTPMSLAVATTAPASPIVDPVQLTTPPSLLREPLLPPPQRLI